MTLLLVVIALLAGILYAAFQVRLHAMASGLSPIRDAVGEYGVGPTAPVFRGSGMSNALLMISLAAALAVEGSRIGPAPILTLLIAAAARVVVVLFPTDPPGGPRTRSGRIHLGATVVQFAALYVFVGQHALVFTAGTPLHGVVRVLTLVTAIGLIGVCLGLLPAARRWFGLFQRIFLYAGTAVVLCCAIALLR